MMTRMMPLLAMLFWAGAGLWAEVPPTAGEGELHVFRGQVLLRGQGGEGRQDIHFVVPEPKLWIWLGTLDKPVLAADYAALAGRECELQARGVVATAENGKTSFRGTAWLSLRPVGDGDLSPASAATGPEAAQPTTAAAREPTAVPLAAAAARGGKIPAHLQAKFAAFDAADQASPPPPGVVLLVGSSSLEIWGKQGAARDLAPHPVVSRAIGGTTTRFQVDHFARLTGAYRPSVIVYYAGDNDIGKNPKAKPEPLAKNFQAYVDLARKHLPETRIVYLSIKPSVQRWAAWPAMDQANRLIQAICEKEPARLTYLDIGDTVLGADGTPDPAMFQQDGLHITPQCYRRWGERLKPVLDRLRGGTP